MYACLLLLVVITPLFISLSLIRWHAGDSFIWNCCYFSLYAGLERKSIQSDSTDSEESVGPMVIRQGYIDT
ncbi:MAG: hypothetical protein C5S49_06630 [Candidatus Methanogaster sp.]|nr:MAG: hypothetical protein C5S49_06630 [ANME-2 cluster archaeon]